MSSLPNLSPTSPHATIDDNRPESWSAIDERQRLRLQQYCIQALDLPDPLEAALHCNIASNLEFAQMINREVLDLAVETGSIIEVMEEFLFAINVKHQVERQAERCVRVVGELRQRSNGSTQAAEPRLAVPSASEEEAN